jgi:hypothetical protein
MGSHTSPKRKRGNRFCPSLALRASVDGGKLYHYRFFSPPFNERGLRYNGRS